MGSDPIDNFLLCKPKKLCTKLVKDSIILMVWDIVWMFKNVT